MITFSGTKTIGDQTALVFKNEHGQSIDLVLNAQTTRFILQNFDRLSPPTPKPVEYADPELSGDTEMVRIYPQKMADGKAKKNL